MVTHNSEFAFIQVKFDNSNSLYCRKTVCRMKGFGVTEQLHVVETLEDLLLEAVDETLRQVFREEGIKVIYEYLEHNFRLKREEIVEKPDVFSAGLVRLLGSAAQVIEILILKNLHNTLGLKFERKEGSRFSECIKELMKDAVVEA